jgi:fido (protein-threonine AMPylation protein)
MADENWQPIPHESPLELSDLTDYVKERGVKNRLQLSVLEYQNIVPVFVRYLSATPSSRLAPFDFTWVLKLHREMFGNVMKSAGTIRSTDLNIGVQHYLIRGELQGLLGDLHAWSDYQMPLHEQAARLHFKAVRIHPFLNGNGRWARMLANIWLKRNKDALILWPEETIGQVSVIRTEYIEAVKEADEGNYQPLIDLHIKYRSSDT